MAACLDADEYREKIAAESVSRREENTMIRYLNSTESLAGSQFSGFSSDRSWPNPPSPDTHLTILPNSAHVVLAYDDRTDCIVGCINAISVGILSADIPLLEVSEPYQGQGIGSELVRRALDQLDGLYMIDVMCDPELEPFYARLGFNPGFAMMIRNCCQQPGAD